MLKHKKLVIIASVCVLILALLSAWIAFDNQNIGITEYKIKNEKIPESFKGFRIAQVSDLHNAEFGKNNIKLVNKLKESQPDIIAITGDLLDLRKTDVEVGLSFAREAVKIAPTYYINGNHEAWIDEYRSFRDELEEIGVTVLENKKITIEREGESISLLGMVDPNFVHISYIPETELARSYLEPIAEDNNFKLLLSHRPVFAEVYAEFEMDLVLMGHNHGGQFRIPFIGGIFSPDEGFFPKYDAGYYKADKTEMIISRGLGNSAFPFRVNNPPEIVVVELE